MLTKDRRAFTLIELLIVIAIIGILAAVLLAGITAVRKKAMTGITSSLIRTIESGLANYLSDEGKYPRRAPRPPGAAMGGADGYRDDCVGLWCGLMNKATRQVGGGGSSPYLEGWDRENIGYYTGGIGGLANGMPTQADGTNQTDQIPGADFDQINLQPFQLLHMPPGAAQMLVLLDPWGGPFHYREWASVRDSTKDAATAGPTDRSGVVGGVSLALDRQSEAQPIQGPIPDSPHNAQSFDIWSNGPNGINEYGHPDSDDVTSWSK
ncbi:MAG: type II secretion system protein [Planctomycetes bacterium]|nr:type II secretion system protein [Planctomycetota bacterium]